MASGASERQFSKKEAAIIDRSLVDHSREMMKQA
jgi:hypothetical protein